MWAVKRVAGAPEPSIARASQATLASWSHVVWAARSAARVTAPPLSQEKTAGEGVLGHVGVVEPCGQGGTRVVLHG